MSHTKDIIEVQYGDRSAILGSYLDSMAAPETRSTTPKAKRSPRSLFSGWSSSSSESSESHEGDHQHQHQKRRSDLQKQARKQLPDTAHHHPVRRQSHHIESDPSAAAPRRQYPAIFSRSERRKIQRIETWAQDVEAQIMCQPLLMDRDQSMPRYRTFDTRERPWTFRTRYSDPGSEQSIRFNSMLARFGKRRSQLDRPEPIGWWWPWIIVALLVLVLLAGGVYGISQRPSCKI